MGVACAVEGRQVGDHEDHRGRKSYHRWKETITDHGCMGTCLLPRLSKQQELVRRRIFGSFGGLAIR